MTDSAYSSNPISSQIGGYEIQRELAGGCTYLAKASGSRKVVLKMLDSDCLLRGQLHPMIKDRLGRVREIAHLGVANLLSAERDGENVFLVWEYVDGQTLFDYLDNTPTDAISRRNLSRQLVLSVESLHGLGLVHGALRAGNVIVTADGQIRLTHISPLLYNDPQVDLDCLLDLLAEMGWAWPTPDHPPTLRQLVAYLSQEGETSAIATEKEEAPKPVATHRWTVIAAIIAAILGIAVAWMLWRYANQHPAEQTMVFVISNEVVA